MAISRREWLRMVAGGAAVAALPGCAVCFRGVEAEDGDVAELTETVAYCGLVCGACSKSVEGRCKGCKTGGGDKNCYQRKCCTGKNLDGCWQCEEFPCDEGYFADANKRWRGLCIGSVQCARNYGVEGYVERLVSRLGRNVDHLEYQYKDPEEMRRILCGD